ncbi:MAG: site-2 protease family protein [Methylobacteriaceae bacterium]|jgi:stage IV sporulation protein FB|nr:site-2 protease family protein [Methylobacteriaceae bacterium]
MNSLLKSLPVGSIFGVRVFIHSTFFLLLVWYMWEGWDVDGWLGAAFYGLFTSLLFACILAHEFGHILAAGRFGINSPAVILWPLGGIAFLSRIDKPKAEFFMTVAGPLVNVVIAGVLFCVLSLFDTSTAYPGYAFLFTYSLLHELMTANLFVAVFNLIPCFPMDGGRILRSALAMKFDYEKSTLIAVRLGQAIACLFLFGVLFDRLMLTVIGVFMLMTAQKELDYVEGRGNARL